MASPGSRCGSAMTSTARPPAAFCRQTANISACDGCSGCTSCAPLSGCGGGAGPQFSAAVTWRHTMGVARWTSAPERTLDDILLADCSLQAQYAGRFELADQGDNLLLRGFHVLDF